MPLKEELLVVRTGYICRHVTASQQQADAFISGSSNVAVGLSLGGIWNRGNVAESRLFTNSIALTLESAFLDRAGMTRARLGS